MIINIPAIKNKYWRYTVSTLMLFTFIPVVFLISVIINTWSELRRAIFNLRLKRLIMKDLTTTKKAIKQMYKGGVM